MPAMRGVEYVFHLQDQQAGISHPIPMDEVRVAVWPKFGLDTMDFEEVPPQLR
jgi:hypothetical protein